MLEQLVSVPFTIEIFKGNISEDHFPQLHEPFL